jgi:hypothetical protein
LVLAKVQVGALQRPTYKSFYVNMPAAISEALKRVKHSNGRLKIEDKNTLVLKQVTQTAI